MHYIIGIDEAGRGPWAGPVVVGGFLVQAEQSNQIFRQLPNLNDSKKLTEKQREDLFHDIERLQFEQECQYTFAYRDATVIDELGIREANRQCMQDVILSLSQFVHPDDMVEIWIDGCDNYRFDSFDGNYVFAKKRRKNDKTDKTEKVDSNHIFPVIARNDTILFSKTESRLLHSSQGQKRGQKVLISYVIHGDSLVPVISAASIIAKVIRDRMMCEFHEEFREYGFAAHKGYGTKQHQQALLNHGITSIHRKSYAPVKRLISNDSSV